MFTYYYTNKKTIGDYDHTDDGLKISLPGIGKENIKVSVVNDTELVVSWEKGKSSGKKVFSIQKIDSVDAKYEDGILYLTLHEKEDKIKKIEIK